MTKSFASFNPPGNAITSSREPSPNRGFSIPSKQALEFDGLATESIATWKHNAKVEERDQIRLVKLSHMRYMHTDFKDITTFLKGI